MFKVLFHCNTIFLLGFALQEYSIALICGTTVIGTVLFWVYCFIFVRKKDQDTYVDDDYYDYDDDYSYGKQDIVDYAPDIAKKSANNRAINRIVLPAKDKRIVQFIDFVDAVDAKQNYYVSLDKLLKNSDRQLRSVGLPTTTALESLDTAIRDNSADVWPTIIDILTAAVNFCNDRYYGTKPVISDEKFERLLTTSQDMATKYKQPLQLPEVGKKIDMRDKPVEHYYAMHSLKKERWSCSPINTIKQLANSSLLSDLISDARWGDTSIVIEPKIDGMACCIQYKNGKLQHMSTRGDGLVGCDVTHKLKHLIGKTIPKYIDADCETVEIIGEIFVANKNFDHNARTTKNFSYASNRHYANSIIAKHDNKDNHRLEVVCFDIHSDINFCTLTKKRNWLNSHGFLVFKKQDLGRINPTNNIFTKINTKSISKDLDIGLEGLVYKIDSISEQNLLGCNAKDPYWAMAIKYSDYEQQQQQQQEPRLGISFA